MLMITVMAFATDYTGQLDYTVKTRTSDLTGPSIAQGTLKIEDYAGGKYTVTATGCDLSSLGLGNWDEIICEGVEATTDANGVTTIDVTPYAYRSSDYAEFKSTKLFVKFKGDKAYATFEGTYAPNSFANYTLKYTFGVDEGFDGGGSTGGGETGGEVKEKYTINFDKTAYSTHKERALNSFSLQQTGKDKQTENVFTSKAAYEDHTSKVFTVEAGSEVTASFNYTGEWMNGYVYIDRDNDGEFSYKEGQWNQEGTDLVAYSFYTTLSNPKQDDGNGYNSTGANVTGNARSNVNPPAFTAPAEPGTYRIRFKVDWNCILPGGSSDILSDGGGIWDATLEVVAAEPEVTVKTEVPFTGVTFSVSNGVSGTADVTFKEMSDETVQMTFNGGGYNVALEGLAKGTDAKGRTTYTGEVSNGTNTYTVNAVVYSEGTTQKLYMTMVDQYSTKFTVGEDPDYVAPEPELTLPLENYKATGKAFSVPVTINWETQKFQAIIDATDCNTEKTEDIFSLGAAPTEWENNIHVYANKGAYSAHFPFTGGEAKDNANVADKANITIEVSKANGLTVDGTTIIAADQLSTIFTLTDLKFGSGQGDQFTKALYKSVKVVDLPTTPVTPEAVVYKNTLKVVRGTDTKTYENAEVSVLAKGENKYAVTIPSFTDMDAGEMEGTIGKLTFEATGVEDGGTLKLTATSAATTQDGGNGWDNAGFTASMDATVTDGTLAGTFTVVYPNDVTNYTYTLYYGVAAPDVITEKSNKTYTSNLSILDGEETVVEEAEAQVNVIKYSDDSYKITLKNVSLLNKTQDLVFEGTALVEETTAEADEPLTIMAKSDEATTAVFGVQLNGTFEITEVSAEEIKMGFSMEGGDFSYTGEFNYEEVVDPEVYTSNLHIYDAAAPETDLFQADQAKVEFLATATGEFKLTLKDVTLNEKTQDLVFTGALPTPQPGGQDPLAEEGEGEVTPAEPAMVLNATADEATATFLGATSAKAVFNVIMNDEAETENDAFALTFTITAGEKTLGGEFNYKKKTPDTPDPELFCKENYVADGNGFEWEIAVDWDTQKIVMSIDPSTCTGSCEDVIGLGAVPTAWDNTLHLYRTSADQMLQGYFNVPGGSNNNTNKFAETAPFLVEVSKAQGFVVNNEVKIASSAMSYLFTLPTVKMGTGEGKNDKSRATYNYVKVVDKDWTAPKDPDTGINATTVAEGEVEFFTVNGVKLNKLQKGLNIVRSADGKVKKVLVK